MLYRNNPTHTYGDAISDRQRVLLARHIQDVMRSAFVDFPIPSSAEIREWLREDNNRQYLFTYSEEGSTDKFAEIKSFISGEKCTSPQALYSELGIDAPREQIEEVFREHAILRPLRSQIEDFIDMVDKLYESGKFVLSVKYFAATADDGEAAQRDYASRVFLPFVRNVLLRDRPVIWAFMRKEAYGLITKERLAKIQYKILFDEPVQIGGEELRQIVMLPQDFIDSARINMFTKKLAVKAIVKVIGMLGD